MNKFISKGYHFASLAFCLATFVIHLIVYPQLPEMIPYHWNFAGQVDQTGPKYVALFWSVFPLILYVLMYYVPRMDPKKDAYSKHKRAYSIFAFVLILFFACISFVILLATLGYPISIISSIGGLLGVLSLVIGNYMRQIRPNFMFGIKTPWTLASDKNWTKTHRLGSILFALVGIYLLIGVWFTNNWWIMAGIFLLILVSAVLYLYSYFLYKKEK